MALTAAGQWKPYRQREIMTIRNGKNESRTLAETASAWTCTSVRIQYRAEGAQWRCHLPGSGGRASKIIAHAVSLHCSAGLPRRLREACSLFFRNVVEAVA